MVGCKSRNLEVAGSSPAPATKICSVCGSSFVSKRPNAKYCGKACKRMAEHPRPQTSVCCVCGKIFSPKQARSKFCSKKCRNMADREGHKNLCQFNWLSIDERLRSDPVFYADHRKRQREASRRYWDKKRKRPYVERKGRRIPDYATKGCDLICPNSEFITTSFEKNAYGRELALERKQK